MVTMGRVSGRGPWAARLALAAAIVLVAGTTAWAAEFTVVYDARTGYIDEVVAGAPGDLRLAEGRATIVIRDQAFPPPATYFKVDVVAKRLIPNDRFEAVWDTSPFQAGSAETRRIEIRKVTVAGEVIGTDTSAVEITLQGVVDRSVDPRREGPPAAHGRIGDVPRAFVSGRIVVEIRAADEAGTDYLVVKQRGLEELWVRVEYRLGGD